MSGGFSFVTGHLTPRIVDFATKVDAARAWYDTLDDNLINSNFQHRHADTGRMMFPVWKTDDAMTSAAYGAGLHRTHPDAQNPAGLPTGPAIYATA